MPELEKETFIHLLERLINNLNLASNIRFELNVNDLIENTRLEERLKINAFRIVQELFVNVIKHSQATKAILNVEISKTHLKIAVEDNGIGITRNDSINTGIGFKNINERLIQNNGTIETVNKKEGGLLVKIIIPM